MPSRCLPALFFRAEARKKSCSHKNQSMEKFIVPGFSQGAANPICQHLLHSHGSAPQDNPSENLFPFFPRNTGINGQTAF